VRRETFLALQKELVRQQKRRMKQYIEQTPELEEYYEEYRRELSRYSVLSYPEELVQKALASRVVYIGDFHTLLQSQRFAERLMDRIAQRRCGPLVLAMEAFPASCQAAVDRYVSGAIDRDALLSEVDYRRTWGFPPEGYLRLLDKCREIGARVAALNSFPRKGGDVLERRDRFAGRILARILADQPEALVVVLIGDLHVATGHLPEVVIDFLGRRGVTIRDLIIYLNSESLYWQLARDGLEYLVNVVKVDSRSYCVFNATPLAKYDSYLRFVEGLVDEDPEDEDDAVLAGSVVVEDQVTDWARRIAESLDIPFDPPTNVELVPCADMDREGDSIARAVGASGDEVPLVGASVRASQPIFVGGSRLLLHRFSLNDAADAAARVLLTSHGWHPYFDKSRNSFYYNVLFEALVYFGSKVINPKRTVKRDADLAAWVEQRSRTRRRSRDGLDVQVLSRFVLPHIRSLDRLVNQGKGFRESPALYGFALAKRMLAMRLLGRRLGERLFFSANVGLSTRTRMAGQRGSVGHREIAWHYRHPPAGGTDTRARYLQVWKSIGDVVEHHRSRQEWF
jgi:uncharacterized iron-regulated protein